MVIPPVTFRFPPPSLRCRSLSALSITSCLSASSVKACLLVSRSYKSMSSNTSTDKDPCSCYSSTTRWQNTSSRSIICSLHCAGSLPLIGRSALVSLSCDKLAELLRCQQDNSSITNFIRREENVYFQFDVKAASRSKWPCSVHG